MSKVKDPQSPASTRQTWAIFVATGYDVRETAITMQQASDLIGMSKDGINIIEAVKSYEGARFVTSKEDAPKALKEAIAASKPQAAKSTPRDTSKATAARWSGVVVLRSTGTGSAQLTVPVKIAAHLSMGMRFKPEITPEGILFRPYVEAPAVDPDLPDWVRNGTV